MRSEEEQRDWKTIKEWGKEDWGLKRWNRKKRSGKFDRERKWWKKVEWHCKTKWLNLIGKGEME